MDGDHYEKQLDIHLPAAYEVYTYQATFGIDITGWKINSSRFISVFFGHACAFVPQGVFFCDHMVEQIPPVGEWGKTHYIAGIAGRQNDAAGYVQSHT